MQLDLLEYIQRAPTPITFGGETSSKDRPRLNAQLQAVKLLMLDGEWRTLREISGCTGAPESSASARLRDLRKSEYTIDRRHVGNGMHEYRLVTEQ